MSLWLSDVAYTEVKKLLNLLAISVGLSAEKLTASYSLLLELRGGNNVWRAEQDKNTYFKIQDLFEKITHS